MTKGTCERDALHRSSGLRRNSLLTQSIFFTLTLSQLKFIVLNGRNRLPVAIYSIGSRRIFLMRDLWKREVGFILSEIVNLIEEERKYKEKVVHK